jgi:hypothetical protein
VKLAEYRSVWPLLTQDILSSLPQASASSTTRPATQPAPGAIVLTHIDPVFMADITATTGGAAPATPAANTSANNNQANNANAVPVSNRGFVITIQGYTTAGAGYDLVKRQFEDVLMAKAKHDASNTKPYYFLPEEASFTGQTIPRPTPSTTATPNAVTPPWGNSHGTYWDIFVPDMAGVHPATPTPGTVVPGGLGAAMNPQARDLPGPVDAFATSRDASNGPQLLYDAFVFTFTFKVHVK